MKEIILSNKPSNMGLKGGERRILKINLRETELKAQNDMEEVSIF